MTPMTTPDSTYWESRSRSNDGSASALGRGHPVARLELGRIDDLHVRERHLGLRVLDHQHRRRPLLPVRALAAGEGYRAVPALELAGQERLHQVFGLVALGGIESVGQEHDLRVAVQRAVDRIFLELGHVLFAEGLAARREL